METWNYFSSPVYITTILEYIDVARSISEEYLSKIKSTNQFNRLYPTYQTDNFYQDPKILTLSTEIIKLGSNILDGQGYDLSNYELKFTEFWCQEHHFGGGQERHVHGYGNVLTGFYFLECPENSCKLIIHEPRSAKEFGTYLPEKNINDGTDASQAINFSPIPGQLIITNSHLPHSFSKNESDEVFKMIHFNITAIYKTATII